MALLPSYLEKKPILSTTTYWSFFCFLALTGYQPTSEFSVFNRNGELLFSAKEGINVIFITLLKHSIVLVDSTCCQRCWCTNSREFTLHILNTGAEVRWNNRNILRCFKFFKHQEVIRMTRALKCCCVCCWCGDCDSCKQELIIESPPGIVIGSVNHE